MLSGLDVYDISTTSISGKEEFPEYMEEIRTLLLYSLDSRNNLNRLLLVRDIDIHSSRLELDTRAVRNLISSRDLIIISSLTLKLANSFIIQTPTKSTQPELPTSSTRLP